MKSILVLFLIHIEVQAIPQNKALEMMQINHQVMGLEQALQSKITESMRLKNEIHAIDYQKFSLLNSNKKRQVILQLSQVEKEITELKNSKSKLTKKLIKN